MRALAVLGAALLLSLSLSPAWADGPPAGPQPDTAPLHSATVVTRLRTLRGLPLKRLIKSPRAWKRVTADLEGAPPPPAFAQGEICVLIVCDEAGGARSWVRKIQRRKDGGLKIEVLRRDGAASVEPHLRAFFLRYRTFQGGIELVHTTVLPEGQGTIQKKFAPDDKERLRRLMPQLGPDLRFSWKAERGATPTGLKLRHETRFPTQRLPARLETIPLPKGVAFPRLRRGTKEQHIYALYCETHRSARALLFDALPPAGPDGSPRVVRHEFVLERRPAGPEKPR